MHLSVYKVANKHFQIYAALLDQGYELSTDVIANTTEVLAGERKKKLINVNYHSKSLAKEVAATRDYTKEICRDSHHCLKNHAGRLYEYLKSSRE